MIDDRLATEDHIFRTMYERSTELLNRVNVISKLIVESRNDDHKRMLAELLREDEKELRDVHGVDVNGSDWGIDL